MFTSLTRRERLLPIIGAVAVVLLLVATTAGSSSHSAGRSGSAEAAAKPDAPVAVNSKQFTAGACMSYRPTVKSNGLTVFLDAGHGGRDPGSVGSTESGKTIDEADLTLPVELDTMQILRREGYRVVVSRTADTSVARLAAADIDGNELTDLGVHNDVAARAICADEAHANILIGIYFDAGDPYNAGSVTGYDADRPFSKKNLRLATLVQNDVLAAMNRQGWQIPNEGVQLDNQLGSEETSAAVAYGHLMLLGPAEKGWVSTPSEMPGALIEPLFITDPFEGSIADSKRGQEVIAGGLAEAVNQYFRR